MVTAMKPVEERFSASDLVLRFYETEGKAVTAKITCPVPLAEAYECDFMEEPLAENRATIDENLIRVPVGAYEVKTLYLRYNKRFAGSLPQGWEGIEIEA
jgi:alpha-mannosidase